MLVATAEVIVPLDPGVYAVLGLVELEGVIAEVREAYNTGAPPGRPAADEGGPQQRGPGRRAGAARPVRPARLRGDDPAQRQFYCGQLLDYDYVLLMSLRIPPDSRISIDSLARELQVSQTPVREALSMLEPTGLVTKRHFIGYCSAPQLSRHQLDELYEVRLLVEPYAARCAAQSAQ